MNVQIKNDAYGIAIKKENYLAFKRNGHVFFNPKDMLLLIQKSIIYYIYIMYIYIIYLYKNTSWICVKFRFFCIWMCQGVSFADNV